MSNDTRKVYNVLRQRDIECDPYEIELASTLYYPNHIISVIDQVLDNKAERIEKAKALGWEYFSKPVNSLLRKRDAAQRQTDYEIGDQARQSYSLVTRSFLLFDFGPAELQILLSELGSSSYCSLDDVVRGIGTAKQAGVRNIFYLRGIITRDVQAKAGKVREATEEIREAEARAWSPPEDYARLDAGERAEVVIDWEERLKEIELSREFDEIAKNQES